ncbi:DUF4865 family protein [Streptomyces europaeiscabiei]|uniref:DUF4865 family protein n=1 Tax=Streptomyces europaeiscabiei TaxID=146819 RepID=UPI0029B0D325|nr:DUF4865 family protein [Streptomyces europaeiscabiei]MDX3692318.1 DUF4865 family protein [Streptomyces europaeiscabiei]
MEVVRRRVASRGHALDAWEGLGLKAYLMRERGVHGSPVNQYAPFYLWNSVEGMNSFFWGGGFQGIVDDFGRPSARQWTGLAYEAGGGADSPARVAVRARRPVPGGVPLGEVVEDAVRGTERLASLDGAVLAAAAVDTSRWEIVHLACRAGCPVLQGRGECPFPRSGAGESRIAVRAIRRLGRDGGEAGLEPFVVSAG